MPEGVVALSYVNAVASAVLDQGERPMADLEQFAVFCEFLYRRLDQAAQQTGTRSAVAETLHLIFEMAQDTMVEAIEARIAPTYDVCRPRAG